MPARKAASWTQDPDGVRRNILAVAREEFVENGLSGARVDEIAAKTSTSKRMIYYYFGGKEGLYRAVLEEMYARIRSFERSLDLAALPPKEAIATLAGFTFDYHADNPDFVRMVMVENIHHAKHLASSPEIATLNLSAIDMIREAYERGVADGVFREGLDPIDIHLTISALSFLQRLQPGQHPRSLRPRHGGAGGEGAPPRERRRYRAADALPLTSGSMAGTLRRLRSCLHEPGHRFDRQLVAGCAHADDDAGRGPGHQRVVIDALAGMDVGDMELDLRSVEHLQRVQKRHRGEGVAGRIDDDAAGLEARFLDALNKHALEIGLAKINGEAQRCGLGGAALADLGQGGRAVDGGFALAQKIQIGAVQHIDAAFHISQIPEACRVP
jgi:AcrR family transcriptional regulator